VTKGGEATNESRETRRRRKEQTDAREAEVKLSSLPTVQIKEARVVRKLRREKGSTNDEQVVSAAVSPTLLSPRPQSSTASTQGSSRSNKEHLPKVLNTLGGDRLLPLSEQLPSSSSSSSPAMARRGALRMGNPSSSSSSSPRLVCVCALRSISTTIGTGDSLSTFLAHSKCCCLVFACCRRDACVQPH